VREIRLATSPHSLDLITIVCMFIFPSSFTWCQAILEQHHSVCSFFPSRSCSGHCTPSDVPIYYSLCPAGSLSAPPPSWMYNFYKPTNLDLCRGCCLRSTAGFLLFSGRLTGFFYLFYPSLYSWLNNPIYLNRNFFPMLRLCDVAPSLLQPYFPPFPPFTVQFPFFYPTTQSSSSV